MAIKYNSPSELITIDCDYLERIALRKKIIQNHSHVVHGHIPSGKESVKELYAYLVVHYLPNRYPTMFRLSTDGKSFHNLAMKQTLPTDVPADTLEALRNLGITVEEDLFLLQQTPEGHQCVAIMCCFPSGWNPASKLGSHMGQIHNHVPSYDKIGPSIERTFAKLEVGRSIRRTNWTVQTHSELFNVKGNHAAKDEYVEQEAIEAVKAFLRVELQTLTRLPHTRAILFSFKTYLYPLGDVKAEGLGPDFATAIEGLQKGNAPGMWQYKGATRYGKSVCEYLRS
ncbi:putative HRQ family protein 2 [Myriangium duriaei CBS 260.36]|uniref:HRQ family protein 2 n=1 Tax=Myriangium duriaei CBS 260.36 TaxID=1168546 RepID=A0A9P4JCJ5_9PEZI|nr:putative HRQ family protein 2 [Myriangium duriaei CBS 260.36]